MHLIGPDAEEVTHSDILQFFSLRRERFIDQMGWELTPIGAYEIDQYDFPYSRFVIAKDAGRCVGGARIMKTNHQYVAFGDHPAKYMLRDFVDGTIQTPMTNLGATERFPCSDAIWEMTRFVSNGVGTTRAILDRVNTYLYDSGASGVLTLSPTNFDVLLARLGYRAKAMSDPVTFEDGRQYQAFLTDVEMRNQMTTEAISC
ncbi:acyl-homoserine-lactone synthase [uncultured Tateyamaria sp.]|uniref:acyl-homoserine-lactone synthase n=1 Tax=uncultured Tateyamaria sp. TaxID=455651 RepID=UPI002615E5AC|nr:acyl-homoserine-lactone synthase [uncultured Tateyamaria sp.]